MRIKHGKTKYGSEGLYSSRSFQNLNLPPEVNRTLATTANQALCKKSWGSYKTAISMLDRCLAEYREELTLPLPERLVTLYVAWLLDRKLSVSTIRAYLSGVRTLHLISGVDPPNTRSPAIQHILTGKENAENRDKKKGKKKMRLPMTPDLMKILKRELINSNMENQDRACFWSVATLAFAGGFRISELLCKETNEFDPDYTLLRKDISLKQPARGKESLQVKVKCDKTNRTHLAVIIDIFNTGSALCPVKAFKGYSRAVTGEKTDQPAFRLASGAALTARKLNNFIKLALTPHLGNVNGFLSSHSFRIGITSLLGQSGMSTEELKTIGRWSSSAYEFYLKLPRTSRLRLAEKVSSLI